MKKSDITEAKSKKINLEKSKSGNTPASHKSSYNTRSNPRLSYLNKSLSSVSENNTSSIPNGRISNSNKPLVKSASDNNSTTPKPKAPLALSNKTVISSRNQSKSACVTPTNSIQKNIELKSKSSSASSRINTPLAKDSHAAYQSVTKFPLSDRNQNQSLGILLVPPSSLPISSVPSATQLADDSLAPKLLVPYSTNLPSLNNSSTTRLQDVIFQQPLEDTPRPSQFIPVLNSTVDLTTEPDGTPAISLSTDKSILPINNLAPPHEKTLINDLIKLNEELIHRVKELEKELVLSKSRLSDVSFSNKNYAATEVPPSASQNSTFTETHIDHIQPPPLIDISTYDVSSTPSSPQWSERHSSSSDDNSKPRLLIVGDSMARGFSEILSTSLPHVSVSGHIYPGCTFETILSVLPNLTAGFTKKDFIFVMAGVNNVPNLTATLLEHSLSKYSSVFSTSNVIFSYVPYVYHKPCFNSNIFATNLSFLKLSLKFKFFVFNCNVFLSRNMYTKHGLHLNSKGKLFFCNKLASILPNSSNVHFLQSALLLSRGIP